MDNEIEKAKAEIKKLEQRIKELEDNKLKQGDLVLFESPSADFLMRVSDVYPDGVTGEVYDLSHRENVGSRYFEFKNQIFTKIAI
jgi:ASC-1-like (ASCH) protein